MLRNPNDFAHAKFILPNERTPRQSLQENFGTDRSVVPGTPKKKIFPRNPRLRVPRLLSNPNASVEITCGIKIFAPHFNWPRFAHGQLGLFTIYLQLPTGVPNNFSPASLTRQNLQNDSTVRK
jgi:hypothetical protein